MNNKKLEENLEKYLSNKKRGSNKRSQITTTIDDVLLSDFKELVSILKIPLNLGLDSILDVLLNDEETLSRFLTEVERRR